MIFLWIENTDAIGKPDVQITKMASGNPLEFKIISTVIPEVKLPDYKAIAKKTVAVDSKKEIKLKKKISMKQF